MGLASPRVRPLAQLAPALLLLALHLPMRLFLWRVTPGTVSWRQGLAGLCGDLSFSAAGGVLALLVALLARPLNRVPATLLRSLWSAVLTVVLALLVADAASLSSTGLHLDLTPVSREAPWIVRATVRAWLGDPWHRAQSAGVLLALALVWVTFGVVGTVAAHNIREVRVRRTLVVVALLIGTALGAYRAGLAIDPGGNDAAQEHRAIVLLERRLLPPGPRPRPDEGLALLNRAVEQRGGVIVDGFPGRHRPSSSPPRLLAEGTNVVMLVLEGGGLAPLGGRPDLAPFLEGLRREGVTLDRHVTSAMTTAGAELGLLCGLQSPPGFDRFPAHAPPLRCLPRLFLEAGYATTALLGPDPREGGRGAFWSAQGFSQVVGGRELPGPHHGTTAQDEVLAQQLLALLDAGNAPRFVHVLASSTRPLPPSREAFSDESEALASVEPVLRGWRHADGVWRRFFEAARQRPWFSRTLFVVVGAHGMSDMSPGDPRRPPSYAAQHARYETLAVMLHPALEGRKVPGGSHVDVPPTVTALLGFSGAVDFAGASLLGPSPSVLPALTVEAGDQPRLAVHLPGRLLWRSVRDGRCDRLAPGRPAEPCRGDDRETARRTEAALIDAAAWGLGLPR